MKNLLRLPDGYEHAGKYSYIIPDQNITTPSAQSAFPDNQSTKQPTQHITTHYQQSLISQSPPAPIPTTAKPPPVLTHYNLEQQDTPTTTRPPSSTPSVTTQVTHKTNMSSYSAALLPTLPTIQTTNGLYTRQSIPLWHYTYRHPTRWPYTR